MKVITLAKKEAQDVTDQPNLSHGGLYSDIHNPWSILDIRVFITDFRFLNKFGVTFNLKVGMLNDLKNSGITSVYELCFLTFRKLNERATHVDFAVHNLQEIE